MSRNLIIAIIAGILVLGGGVLFYAMQSDTQSNLTESTTPQNQEEQSTNTAEFDPANTLENDFEATIATEADNVSFNASVEYDKDTKSWRYVAENSDQQMELIVTSDAYYSKVNGNWIKLPTSGEANTGFDADAYEVTAEELADFQSRSSYEGEASCPAGTCDLWVVENYEGNTKLSFYVDKETNTINQLITESDRGTNTITYTYKDVSVEVPENAQEVPSLGQ